MGRPADGMPEHLMKKAASFGEAGPELREAARDALYSILAESELLDLWVENDPAAFNLAVTSLIDRLNPALPAILREKRRGREVRQTGGSYNGDLDPRNLVALSIHQPIDDINVLDRSSWCHLACVNGSLHLRHIVQNWSFKAEALEQDVGPILDRS